jgi:NhaC family Na+:H+ antiporter
MVKLFSINVFLNEKNTDYKNAGDRMKEKRRFRHMENVKSEYKPSFGIALLIVIFLFAFLVIQIIQAGSPDIHLTLVFSISFATLVLMLKGMKWKKIEEGVIHGCKIATIPMLILMFIGMLIPTWIASGTIPVLIYYGLQMISPSMFLFTAGLICSVASLATGSSWTTGATFGVAFMGISLGLGIPAPMAAGAIISGAIIGDKLSPLSDSTICSNISKACFIQQYPHLYFPLSFI